MNPATIWAQEMNRPNDLKRKKERLALEDLPFDNNQLRWLIRNYKGQAIFPSVVDFCEYAKSLIDDVPEELSCAAFLSGNGQLAALAYELETLCGAWSPDEWTENRIEELRSQLREVLA